MKTAERDLLKGFTGAVTDIAFAHLATVLLGAVDEVGNMFIYEISEAEMNRLQYPFRGDKKELQISIDSVN